MKPLLFVLLLAALAYSQYVNVFYIDYFRVNTPVLIVQIPSNPRFPIIQTSSTLTSTVIGGERDLLLEVTSGSSNRVVTAGVSGGNFTASTPNGARGFSTLTYDGEDSSSALNPSGLFNSGYSNFELGGGFALVTSIRADLYTSVTFTIYSGSTSAYCQYILYPYYNGQYVTYILQYANFVKFSGGCDFTRVGAVVITFNQPDNLDVEMQYLAVYGVYPISPSVTPTITPSAFRSSTRSGTSTPTVTSTAAISPAPTISAHPTAATSVPPPVESLSATPSADATISATPSAAITPSSTKTPTPTRTRTLSSTVSATSTRNPYSPSRTPSNAPPNCYSNLRPTAISPGSCMVLNSCTVTNKNNVYFQYDYSYETQRNSLGGVAYYFIPSEQPITSCSTLSKYCYSVCGATNNPLLGYVYLGNVNNHEFQLWAYYNNYNSNSQDLFINGTSVITFSN